jgi:hypothetical protein
MPEATGIRTSPRKNGDSSRFSLPFAKTVAPSMSFAALRRFCEFPNASLMNPMAADFDGSLEKRLDLEFRRCYLPYNL